METPKITSRSYLFVTVFVAGLTTLAIEFVTSRMLQTVYGTSNIVWANVIGLVLAFLTLGYFIGGRMADRNPSEIVFYRLVCFAGFSATFFLLVTSLLLKSAATAMAAINMGAIGSSLVGVVLALAVPITLLGCISPFAIRLGVRNINEAGRISGRIYALSTWGSLLGTYLPVLIVIPEFGTRLSAVIFGTILLLVGLFGLWQASRASAYIMSPLLLALIGASFAWTSGDIKTADAQIFETESGYNYIQVQRYGDCNYLMLNEGQAFHSYYCDNSRVPRISVWGIMLSAPFFNSAPRAPQKVAVIGLAAGTVAKQFTQVYGSQVQIDGIELDPKIVEVGQQFFDLNEPNLNVIVGDGRYELNRLGPNYDVITIDAYRVPYIPWHLTTKEFFEEVSSKLSADGTVTINVGRVPDDRRLVEAMTATMLQVFPTVHTIDIENSLNTILVATKLPTNDSNLVNNLRDLNRAGISPLLAASLETAAFSLQPTVSSDLVFTDERAPVETLIDSIVVRYLLTAGPEGLPTIGGEG